MPPIGIVLLMTLIIGVPAGLSIAWDSGKFEWGQFFGMMAVVAFASIVLGSCVMMGKV